MRRKAALITLGVTMACGGTAREAAPGDAGSADGSHESEAGATAPVDAAVEASWPSGPYTDGGFACKQHAVVVCGQRYAPCTTTCDCCLTSIPEDVVGCTAQDGGQGRCWWYGPQ